MTHICVGKLIIIGSDNGLSPDRRQAIIWTNAWLLSIGPTWTYFSENLIKIQQFSLKKMHVKMSPAKWRPSCLGLNVLIHSYEPGWVHLFYMISNYFATNDYCKSEYIMQILMLVKQNPQTVQYFHCYVCFISPVGMRTFLTSLLHRCCGMNDCK